MSKKPEKRIGLIRCLTRDVSPEAFNEFGWMGAHTVKDIVLTFFILGAVGTNRFHFRIPSWTTEYELEATLEKLKASGVLVETADGIKLSHAPAWLSVEAPSTLRMRKRNGINLEDKNVFLNVAREEEVVRSGTDSAVFSFVRVKESQGDNRTAEIFDASDEEADSPSDETWPIEEIQPETFRKYAFLGDKAVRKIAIAEHVIRAIESGLDIVTPDWASDIELEYILSEMVSAGTIIPVGARFKLAEEN